MCTNPCGPDLPNADSCVRRTANPLIEMLPGETSASLHDESLLYTISGGMSTVIGFVPRAMCGMWATSWLLVVNAQGIWDHSTGGYDRLSEPNHGRCRRGRSPTVIPRTDYAISVKGDGMGSRNGEYRPGQGRGNPPETVGQVRDPSILTWAS